MATDSEVLLAIDSAFGSVARPEHFTDVAFPRAINVSRRFVEMPALVDWNSSPTAAALRCA